MATAARRTRSRQKATGKANKSSNGIFWVAAGGLVVLFGLAIVMTRPWSEPATSARVEQFRAVTVGGRPLPEFGSGTEDPAVGMQIPTFRAETFAGDPVSVTADGRPKVLMFLAHWCPHCQADVRSIQAWLDGGSPAQGVDLYGVSTWADPAKPNFPPSDWLDAEGWTVTTAVDDEANTLASTYGLTGTPMYVFVDDKNLVRLRYSGELPIDQFEKALAAIR